MKVFSNIGLAKFFVSLLIFSWIFIVSLIVVNNCLSCLTKDGCLRIQCDYEWLKDEYKDLVDKNRVKCENRNILLPKVIETTETIKE